MTEFWRDGPSVPIPVADGIAAASERGQIGQTWWSQRFLAVLETLSMGGRLTRGKSYARKGQVVSLELVPGVVMSTVQGSRPQPYTTTITLPRLPEAVWERVEEALRTEAVHAARLLAGEMPPDLERIVQEAGGHLFPQSARELVMRCSCPDVGNPCKHLAATFYLLAETFDEDPFRILLWRGRTREQLLSGLGTPAAHDTAVDPDAADDPGGGLPGISEALADLPTRRDDDATGADRFWLQPVPLPDAHSGRARMRVVDAAPDQLLRQLPDPPRSLGGESLSRTLRQIYSALARSGE